MGTVWWVESGEYSDYRVHGLFSTEANADLYAKTFGGEVVEIELDKHIDVLRAGLKPMQVFMYRDGESDVLFANLEHHETRFNLRGEYEGGTGILWASMLIVYGWFKDEAHAAKVANEKRAQMIAGNEWPEDNPEASKHERVVRK